MPTSLRRLTCGILGTKASRSTSNKAFTDIFSFPGLLLPASRPLNFHRLRLLHGALRNHDDRRHPRMVRHGSLRPPDAFRRRARRHEHSFVHHRLRRSCTANSQGIQLRDRFTPASLDAVLRHHRRNNHVLDRDRDPVESLANEDGRSWAMLVQRHRDHERYHHTENAEPVGLELEGEGWILLGWSLLALRDLEFPPIART